jgi:hypothetical protein
MTARPVSRPDPTRSTWYPYPPGPVDELGRLLEDEYAGGMEPRGCLGVLVALFGMVVIVVAIVAVAAALAP